ncbi:4a-hydroxytetrahydrobiopterin dehydratase [Acidicapsa acidisoli]|uniref:4a-hydroxytetrahydrobiopterin dehydratase n=1 Tax=Acidicapsa acidisoli TaxID=1615681 RepID=UPI0021DFDDF4|nr:4a-hydroxytetrahydrobiopterin dehydratase [Acidicapsa acidisoli]
MPAFSSAEIEQGLATLPDWKLNDGNLVRNFSFTDFREAMSFVNSVAALAERAGHHPDIDIRYNKVNLALSSHDAGGITERDFSLAAGIDKIL